MVQYPQLNTPALLDRLLANPEIISQVRTLPPPALLKLIHHIGFHDSGELLAMATVEQLTEMMDEDLWRQENRGGAETFSPERLHLWLAAMEEMGYRNAAERLCEMDEEFLCFLFSHYFHAIDSEALQFLYVRVEGDSWQDDRLESLLESQNSHELCGVLVLARATAPWETLIGLLLALEETDSSLTSRLLHRLCDLTEAKAEKEGGLYEVLSREEMTENDALDSRNARRTRAGFVSAEDATALLGWLRQAPEKDLKNPGRKDPVSASYFRLYEGNLLHARDRHPNPLLSLLGETEKAESFLQLPAGDPRPLSVLVNSLDRESRFRFQAEMNLLAQSLILTRKGPALRPSDAAMMVIRACEEGLKRSGDSSLGALSLFGLGFHMR